MNRVKLTLLDGGHCSFPEHVVHRNLRFKPLKFPSLFGLIEHPKEGVILYDTGYSQQFFRETRRFPSRLYRFMTPVSLGPTQAAVHQLAARGIRTEDVRFVICSHFHADHISALEDFPQATYFFLEDAWRALRSGGWSALRHGYLPGLLPADFATRARPVDDAPRRPLPPVCAPFEYGLDLLGDGSLLGVELPGHAAGQLGLFLRREDGHGTFLVADACWTSHGCHKQILPHPVTRLLFDDHRVYAEIFARLGELSRRAAGVEILPSHCLEVRNRWVAGEGSETHNP